MVWYFTPYSMNGNLGAVFNQYCKMVPYEDWICIMDGDCMFLNSNYGHIIQRYIDKYPECDLFIPLVNRVSKKSQCYNNERSENSDLRYHKEIADEVSRKTTVTDLTPLKRSPSLPVFIFSKKTWFDVGGFEELGRILGVDVHFSRKVHKKGIIYLMEGLYMLHYYRLCEGRENKEHLDPVNIGK